MHGSWTAPKTVSDRRHPAMSMPVDGPNPTHDDAVEPCDNCGDPVDLSNWHPLDARVDETGDATLYVFCSRECRTEWNDGSADP